MRYLDKYKVYSLNNFKNIPQIQKHLSEEEQFEIQVVGNVLPLKANNYVVERLIDWKRVPEDPIFNLTFPQKEMLDEDHFNLMADAIKAGAKKPELKIIANKIRMDLNPHPAGQMTKNVP